MSTSNQHQRGGRRQPFGFLHANTLSTGKAAKGSGAVAGSGGVGGAASAAHSSDPVKNESQKKFRGVLTSIVSRTKQGKKNERSHSGSSSSVEEENVSILQSPTKKNRITTGEDPKTDTTANTVTAAKEDKRSGPTGYNEFDANETAGVFRPRPALEEDALGGGFWDDEMEDMLELKQANPIMDYSLDDEEDNILEDRIDPTRSLAKELDENASGVPLSWSNRLPEGDDGFKIYREE
mmetsp:Transcript_37744/g.79063  ORF Transcript_37744/g.79063 Transcript_37744/m.79063 type:complete len:237 (-) Transcript_37744:214-924(-)